MAIQDIIQYSTTAASNTTIGTSISIAEGCAAANINNAIRELMQNVVNRFGNTVSVASSGTVALGDQEEQYVIITGTTTITSFGTPGVANKFAYFVKFSGALTLTHNATSLILPGGASITTAAGDCAIFQHEGSGNWRCLVYSPATGKAVVPSDPATTFITGQTEDTTPDLTADYMLTYDASAAAFKKVLLKRLPTVVQIVNTQNGTVATGTTTIPYDNTKPDQSTPEGDEYMSLSITPTNASNKLKIDVVVNGAYGNATARVIAALFQDSTALALAAACMELSATGHTGNVKFTHYMTAGTTSSTTFKVRAGGTVAGQTFTFNGAAGSQLFGGAMASSITITEIKV